MTDSKDITIVELARQVTCLAHVYEENEHHKYVLDEVCRERDALLVENEKLRRIVFELEGRIVKLATVIGSDNAALVIAEIAQVQSELLGVETEAK